MGFFDKLREIFRDKTIDNICAGLQNLGIDAQRAEHGRLINIREGPIAWINVHKETYVGGWAGEYAPAAAPSGPPGEERPSYDYYYTEYGVPDSRLSPIHSRCRIMSACVRPTTLFDQASDLHWRGEDFGLGIIDRLDSDISLKQPIMQSCDVTIRALGDQGCWIILTETSDVPKGPSQELWDCYQTIAKHLLSAPL